MTKLARISLLMAAFGLIACSAEDGDSQATQPTSRAATSAQPAPATASDPALDIERIGLFSDTLHDITMAAAGHARVEAYGQSFDTALMADCSAATEAPPIDMERALHSFRASFTVHTDNERRIDVEVIRTINLDEELTWRQMGHEIESVHLALKNRAGTETFDQRAYSLRRARPEATPQISRSVHERPMPPEASDEVPAIRVHPDGQRATFVGRLGSSVDVTEPGVEQIEEVKVAIHCGPV